MIIYGAKSKVLAKEPVTQKCPNCESQHTLNMYVVQRYAHVFWIPLFPFEKTGISECSNCKQVLELRKMPPALVSAFPPIKANAKTPIWMFVGLALIGVLIISATITGQKEKADNAKFVLAPKTGDIYEVKTPDNKYTLMKIIEVQKDSVYVKYNNYETDNTTGINQLKDKAYSEEVYALKKSALKNMFDKGDIYGIERN